MRFLLPTARTEGHSPELYRAYLSGFDGRVYATRIEISGGTLLCRRTVSDSGRLNVAWPVAGLGRPILATTSLMERSEPYLLVVELARGKICSLRDQMSAWQLAGMQMPEQTLTLAREAHAEFAQAAAEQSDVGVASAFAQQALEKACRAADLMMRSYIRQRILVRRRKSGSMPTVLACGTGTAEPVGQWTNSFTEAFNAALIPIRWPLVEPDEGEYHWDFCDDQLEWCRERRLIAYAGPLIDFGPNGLPRWLQRWENDFFNLQSFLSDFVETAVSRYIGRIRNWEIAARGNTGGGFALSEEHRLMLVARVLEAARQVNEDIQLMIRVDQPWGDYQARGQHQLTPMQFVDALMRSGVELSAVNLEIDVGYRPRGSGRRDLLDFSRILDQWSALGVPLNLIVAVPSSTSPDPNADGDLEVESSVGDSEWNERAQAAWIEDYVPLMMAKQGVAGVFWNHFQDGIPHEYPHAGLLLPNQTPKPALEQFIQLRREYWKPDDRAN